MHDLSKIPDNVPADEWEAARNDVITKSQKSSNGYAVGKANILGPLNDDDLHRKVMRRKPHAMCDRRNPSRVGGAAVAWTAIPVVGGISSFYTSTTLYMYGNMIDAQQNTYTGAMMLSLTLMTVCALTLISRTVYLRSGEDAMSRKEVARVQEAVTVVDTGTGRFSRDTRRLANTAAGIAQRIGRSPAYQSSAFDLDRIRVNIPEELRQIIASCEILNRMEERLDRVKVQGWEDMSIKDMVLDRQEKYDLAKESIIARVTAMNVYLRRLNEVESLIATLNRECYVVNELLSATDNFDEAFASITGNHDATSHTLDRAEDIRALKERIQVQLEFIRTNILGAGGLGLTALEA